MTAPGGEADGSRVRVLGDHLPGDAERDRLVATLGATLRALRARYGLSTRRLALRAATSRSTITRLERGERRPRRSMLSSLALALDPDAHLELLEVLVAAAGPSLRPETNGSRRCRRRAMEAGILAGRVPMPSRIARALALHARANAAQGEAEALLVRPGALDDVTALTRARELMGIAAAARREAGPPFTLKVGGHVIRAGM
ncbi:helix-turn-helix domain-containing protein [Nonomuraea rhizosphaerae]|uniref:helix-turn-helix domain-containing protein n=1 Tax=Nonomuraea rhizosphaerae TaxID=2665663 RepID=UPI001FE9C449|nr:helix-turn-helix transcriptional regulator [Nonomuraea rhizosphaerae]